MINFKVLSPCKNCPFRKDCLPGWLGLERAQEIANATVFGDSSFSCHKTVHGQQEEGQRKGAESFCAGALALEEKANKGGNLFIRLARLFKHFDYSALKGKDLVFDSVDDFIKHHTNG